MRIHPLLILLTGLLLCSFSLSAQDQQLIISLKKPGLPGMLKFENPKGSIQVTGYDGNILLITGKARFEEKGKAIQPAFKLSYEANGNDIRLFCESKGKTVDIEIKVPVNFSMQLRSMDNGDIKVMRINGEIEVDNTNGHIFLEGISGSAVLNSVYGNIVAGFKEVTPDAPMMMTTLEGYVELSLPSNISARIKMKSANGKISSEYKLSEQVKNGGTTSDWTTVILNGGGPDYILRSYNGSVSLKKKMELL
jgi:hypothetical protein